MCALQDGQREVGVARDGLMGVEAKASMPLSGNAAARVRRMVCTASDARPNREFAVTVADLFKRQENGIANLRVEFALEGFVDDNGWECGLAFQFGQGVSKQICKAIVNALNLNARCPGVRVGVYRGSAQADGRDHIGKAFVEIAFENRVRDSRGKIAR